MRTLPALAGLLFTCALQGAIWPDKFAGLDRTSAKSINPAADRAIWDEYGLDEIETASYGSSKLTATAWRLRDSTAALGVFQWLRPADARPWKLEKLSNSGLSVRTGGAAMLAFGNYVFRFDGPPPADVDIIAMSAQLPELEQSPLPPLLGYLPASNLVPNSERYILGPSALDRFRPGVPPSTAAFHFGTEGLTARYQAGAGTLALTVFYYPSPQIAQERAGEFRKLSNSMVKRSGPLVALILSPQNADDAERLLAQVNYRATITWSERTPHGSALELGNMLISIFALCGVLILFCLLSGLAFGGLRVLLLRLSGQKEGEDSITVLHLGDR